MNSKIETFLSYIGVILFWSFLAWLFVINPIYQSLRPPEYTCENITIPYETEYIGEESTLSDITTVGVDGQKEVCTPDKDGYDVQSTVIADPITEVITYKAYEPFEFEYTEPAYYGGGAICNDGSRSYSTGRGTCSWHGGVQYYL